MPGWVPIVFGASGFAALIYQVVWQRVLYSAFGVNVEAVTTIVSSFLAGLGFGSLVGGRLAAGSDRQLLRRFALAELAVGLVGVVSIEVFRWMGELTASLAPAERGIVLATTAMVPTSLMGITLPILVEYVVRQTGNVGRTVGRLYFVNTAGSAVAAFAAVLVVLGRMGEHGSVNLAAAVNVIVAGLVFCLALERA